MKLPRHLWKTGAAALASLWLAGCTTTSPATPTEKTAAQSGDGAPWTLTIAHINDSHSNIDPLPRTLALAAHGDGQRAGVQVSAGGFTRVKTLVDRIRASRPNVIALHGGDSITGTLYFNRTGALGEADATAMRAVCFDASTLGNHEFDKGDTVLAQYIGMLNSGKCQTRFVSANLQPGPSSALAASKNKPALVQPYTVLERDGRRIGIVGLTTAIKTKQSSSPDPDTRFEDETVAAQRAIDALRAQGVEIIVVLSHIGYEADKELVQKLDGVDVVVGGDSHTLLGPKSMSDYRVGTPAGPYPTVLKNRDGEKACVVQANEYAKIVGELQVQFDQQGRVLDCSGTPHVPVGDDFMLTASKTAPDAATRERIDRDMAASGFLTPATPDPALHAALAPYRQRVEAFKTRIVGRAPQELCSRRVPGGIGTMDYSRSSADCNALGEVKERGGDIQQIVAHAFLDEAKQQYGGADIALQNGGGARVPLQGDVTAARVLEVMPFSNVLWRMSITGAEAKDMLEDGLEATFGKANTSGSYPYTAGMRFEVDARAPFGQRVSRVEVFDQASSQWKPLDPKKTYRLFLLSFIANGGDGYATLAKVPKERREDIGVVDADAFFNWISRQPKDTDGVPLLHKLPAAWYSTQRYIAP